MPMCHRDVSQPALIVVCKRTPGEQKVTLQATLRQKTLCAKGRRGSLEAHVEKLKKVVGGPSYPVRSCRLYFEPLTRNNIKPKPKVLNSIYTLNPKRGPPPIITWVHRTWLKVMVIQMYISQNCHCGQLRNIWQQMLIGCGDVLFLLHSAEGSPMLYALVMGSSPNPPEKPSNHSPWDGL